MCPLQQSIEIRDLVYDGRIEPRYEFRVWDRRLDDVVARIRASSECHEERWSTEIYIACRDCSDVNLKMRNGLLDLKTLHTVRDGFEQWAPALKADFPVTDEEAEAALHQLGIDPPTMARTEYSVDEFINELVEPAPSLAPVTVTKRRCSFTVGGCMTEQADVVISGTPLTTVAIESADLGALRAVHDLLGFERFENVSYPLHIKRMMGWDHSPAMSAG